MAYVQSFVSILSLYFGPHFSFLQNFSSNFFLLPVATILPLLEILLVGKEFLTEKALNQMNFVSIFILRPKFCSFHPGSRKCLNLSANGTSGILFEKNNLSIMISMGELFLIPTHGRLRGDI